MTVCIRRYKENDPGLCRINIREIWRYAGLKGELPKGFREDSCAGYPDADKDSHSDEPLGLLLEEVLSEARGLFNYGLCYLKAPLDRRGEKAILPFEADSGQIDRLLKNSREVIVMAATIGHGIDRKIARYKKFGPTKALLFQALGAERIEALCDLFCAEIKKEEEARGNTVTPRFSPGYGDLSLSVQTDIVRILDCGRNIGVSLNKSLLMSPSKSVTAIFGIEKRDGMGYPLEEGDPQRDETEDAKKENCIRCGRTDCEFRREL